MSKILLILAVLFTCGVAFAADPHSGTTSGKTTYMYDGHCAWGVSQGKLVQCDSSHSADTTWTDTTTHKSYCFLNKENKASFAHDTKTSIAKADSSWPSVQASLHTSGNSATH